MVFHDDEEKATAAIAALGEFAPSDSLRSAARVASERRRTRRARVSDPLDAPPERFSSGFPSLDDVLGGGLTSGACYMLPGPPGAGKSTLAMEMAGSVAARGRPALYLSTERTRRAVHQDAVRLELSEELHFDGCDYLQDIADILEAADEESPSLLVVDSVQSATRRASMKGDLARWTDVMKDLCSYARSRQVTVIAVSQVTKEGCFAGSRSLEHDSDVFAELQWDAHLPGVRVLTVGKNRFGPSGGEMRFGIGKTGIETVDAFLESLAAPSAEELTLFESEDE